MRNPSLLGTTEFLRNEAMRCPTVCADDYPNLPNAGKMLNYLLERGELEVVMPMSPGTHAMPAILRWKRPQPQVGQLQEARYWPPNANGQGSHILCSASASEARPATAADAQSQG